MSVGKDHNKFYLNFLDSSLSEFKFTLDEYRIGKDSRWEGVSSEIESQKGVIDVHAHRHKTEDAADWFITQSKNNVIGCKWQFEISLNYLYLYFTDNIHINGDNN